MGFRVGWVSFGWVLIGYVSTGFVDSGYKDSVYRSRMFLNVLLVFGAPLWFFVLLTIFRCSLKVLVVLKMVGDVPSWFVV